MLVLARNHRRVSYNNQEVSKIILKLFIFIIWLHGCPIISRSDTGTSIPISPTEQSVTTWNSSEKFFRNVNINTLCFLFIMKVWCSCIHKHSVISWVSTEADLSLKSWPVKYKQVFGSHYGVQGVNKAIYPSLPLSYRDISPSCTAIQVG